MQLPLLKNSSKEAYAIKQYDLITAEYPVILDPQRLVVRFMRAHMALASRHQQSDVSKTGLISVPSVTWDGQVQHLTTLNIASSLEDTKVVIIVIIQDTQVLAVPQLPLCPLKNPSFLWH
jgi:hypothetical protein